MKWTHKRNLRTADRKKQEAKSGTKWSFIAAATVVA
jgi:hypothetical protein